MWWWWWWSWLWSGWALGAAACGAQCACRGEQLACSHVPYGAYRVPGVPAHVRHVSVSAARLGVLSAAALDGRALATLVLVASHLHHIERDALASMTHTLASLDLGYNEFTEIPIEAVGQLNVLNWLNLQNNYIDEIAADTEWGALGESLSSLSLSNNQLVSLKAGALAPLRRLARLDLEGNRLHAVEGGALPAALAMLRLSDNLLPAVPCAALAALPRLRHLHLRANSLRDRFEDAGCPLDRLRIEHLDLSQNELDDRFISDHRPRLQLKRLILDLNEFTSIPSFVTEGGGGALRLQKLSISYNRVSHVSDATLFALRRDLERLELDHNELRAVPRAVRELAQLRYLSLAYNRLEEVDSLPPHVHSLGLAGNFLQGFPSSLRQMAPATLLYLDLSYNQISTVARETFGAWSDSLATLNLRGNRISQVSRETFPASLPLRELVLSFNDLRYVERDAFLDLTTLHTLELSTASFSGEFPISAAPEKLSWLNLDNNDIHYLTAEDVMNLPALEYLNLDFNKLVEFPSDVTNTNVSLSLSLKELRLSYNDISKLNCDFLERLRAVRHLDLTFNRLVNVSEKCFVNMPNLAYLSISENMVESMGAGAFSRLPRLEVLDLHHNLLSEFSTEYFHDVSADERHFTVNASHNRIASLVGTGGANGVSIDCLDLSHNKLKTLSKSFFESLGAHVRQLVLSHNALSAVDSGSLGALPSLQILSLNNNNITVVKRRAFGETPAIEILDLSHNRIHQLAVEQFDGLRHLRQVRLDDNELRSLPRDCFKNTIVEHLELSGNRLGIFPSSALAQVGFTLRRLELARNRLEYLDAAMFRATAFLHELDLAENALTVLADNTFAALARLRALDLSGNAIKANFKEVFGEVPRLRRLSVARCGLRAVPPLPLAELVHLDLGDNPIASYREADVRRTPALRTLRLADDLFASLRPAMWAALPRLLALDVSGNPVGRIARGSLEGLARLQHLRLERLRHLEAVEPRAFRSLVALRSLALDSPTSRAARDATLAEVTAATPSLESLRVTVRTETLDAQLGGVRAPRLRELEVRGAALRRVSARAFSALGGQRALTLRVRGTGVRTLPAGVVLPLARVPHLALDLSDNELVALAPDTLYPNLTGWDRFGTKILPGGLVVWGERLSCGCGVRWASAWLRRWAAEVGEAGAGGAVARASWCAAGAGRRTPLVALRADAEDAGAACPAPRHLARAPAFLWIVLLYSIS